MAGPRVLLHALHHYALQAKIILADFNLAVSTPTAKPPNLIPHQLLWLYVYVVKFTLHYLEPRNFFKFQWLLKVLGWTQRAHCWYLGGPHCWLYRYPKGTSEPPRGTVSFGNSLVITLAGSHLAHLVCFISAETHVW